MEAEAGGGGGRPCLELCTSAPTPPLSRTQPPTHPSLRRRLPGGRWMRPPCSSRAHTGRRPSWGSLRRGAGVSIPPLPEPAAGCHRRIFLCPSKRKEKRQFQALSAPEEVAGSATRVRDSHVAPLAAAARQRGSGEEELEVHHVVNNDLPRGGGHETSFGGEGLELGVAPLHCRGNAARPLHPHPHPQRVPAKRLPLARNALCGLHDKYAGCSGSPHHYPTHQPSTHLEFPAVQVVAP